MPAGQVLEQRVGKTSSLASASLIGWAAVEAEF